jgi:hypothetical protein
VECALAFGEYREAVTVRVVFTAFNRLDYLRMTLRSWAQVRGIDRVVFDFHVEPSEVAADVIGLISKELNSLDFVIHVNSQVLGTQENPYRALECAFTYGSLPSQRAGDFVILAEDDIVVSSDILEYFTWAKREYRSDDKVLMVSAHQHNEQPGGLAGTRAGGMEEAPLLWVWGTWRDRWEKLAADWPFNYEYRGWDWRIYDYWVGELGYQVVTPSFSRCQHIGVNGTHMMADQYLDWVSRCFRPVVPPQEYRQVTG